MELTEKQIKILKLIIETYIETAKPISSNEILPLLDKKISSATIRNIMADLEQLNLIQKLHTSGGRIPTTDGYKYYNAKISKPKIGVDIKKKLLQIFSNRDLSIDTIVDQSVSILNEMFNLPIVINKQDDEMLKRIDLIQLDENNALIIIVSNSGNITKHEIKFDSNEEISDISTCIRVFNDRLVDTYFSQIHSKLDSIQNIIRSSVHNYETCFQKFITKIFEKKIINKKIYTYGTRSLTTQPEFNDLKKLNNVLEMLEDTNVWKIIAYNMEKTGNTSISFGDTFGKNDLVVASTKISTNEKKYELNIVGPTRINYSKIQGILNFIKEIIETKEKI